MRLSITPLSTALLRQLSRSTLSIAATSRPSLIVMFCHPQHDTPGWAAIQGRPAKSCQSRGGMYLPIESEAAVVILTHESHAGFIVMPDVFITCSSENLFRLWPRS